MLTKIFAASYSSSVWYYGILYLLTMVEGPIATLVGGALTANGLLLPIPVYFSVVLGNLTADLCWYTLGRFGKSAWITRFFSEGSTGTDKIGQLTKDIQVHAPRLLFLSKFTTGFPVPTLIATGMGRVAVHRWFGWLLLGELIKSAILVSLGYFFSTTVGQTQGIVQTALWMMTGLLLLAGFAWFKLHKRKKLN